MASRLALGRRLDLLLDEHLLALLADRRQRE
jgi:hypothetical protein